MQRGQLIRWLSVFTAINIVLIWLIGTEYLPAFQPHLLPETKHFGVTLLWVFIAITYVSYFALLTTLWVFVPTAIISLLLPKPRLIKLFALLAALSLSLFLIVDGQVFALFRFHINQTIFNMIISGEAIEIFSLSQLEWVIIFAIAAALVCLQWFFIWLSNRFYQTAGLKKLIRRTGMLLLTGVVFSYLTLLMSMGFAISAFNQQGKVFPLYTDVIASVLPIKKADIERFAEGRFVQLPEADAPLHYPLKPMQCDKIDNPLNVVLIVVDSWRFDAITPEIMPTLSQYKESAWQFMQHSSGGNGTRSGLFSLFYGLPGNYWTSMLRQQVGPVLFDQLLEQDYQVSVFASGELKVPEFDQTVFLNIKDLRVKNPAATSIERDQYTTDEFLNFINQHKAPFFSVVYYDAPHSYCMDQALPEKFTPFIKRCNRIGLENSDDPTPYFNRYKNAVYSIDQQLAQLFKGLTEKNLWQNTVVIITGDHGQEFNDNQMNYWEHASNFTAYQIQTPLWVFWPGKSGQQFHHLTNHYDIVPTIMQRLLGCENPSQEYSIGRDLLISEKRPYFIVGSYIHMGIVEPDRITTLYTSGNFLIQDPNAKPLPEATARPAILQPALQDMRRFYQGD